MLSSADKQADDLQRPTAPSISLPKGGGAIRGIGEKFAASPVTGSGSMTVPVFTSPGRSGFGPQLSLTYDSGSGNGPFGFGWSLSLPQVTRKTEKGLPRYQDEAESDVFILSGTEDLVPMVEQVRERTIGIKTYHVKRFRPRVEGLFSRIERWTNVADPGDVHWRSISRDNILTLYGRDISSRIADPANPKNIFSWLVCEIRDDKGNGIVYDYVAENSDNIDRSPNERNRVRTANRYLKRIRYGNRRSLLDEQGRRPHFVSPEQFERADWMFEVVLDYEEHHVEELVFLADELPAEQHDKVQATATAARSWAARPDPFSSYRSGFEVRTYRRCHRFLMFHRFEELGPEPYLVRSTELDYADLDVSVDPSVEAELTHQGSTRFASFVHSIAQCGYLRDEIQPLIELNGARYFTYLQRSLPAVVFEYSKPGTENDPGIQDTVQELDPRSLENLPSGLGEFRCLDLDGEGLSGILIEQDYAWFYKPNLGEGRFGPMQRVARRPSIAARGSGTQQFLDLAGDGQLDLVQLERSSAGFYERRDLGEDWETFSAFASLPNLAWDDPNLRFVDLTGDGHADILITEDEAFTWYPSLAEEGFDKLQRVQQTPDEETGPRLVFADGTESVCLADMSGDGLSDLVRIRNGEVCYWPNLGYGRFGAKVAMDNAPIFEEPDQFDQRRIRLVDIDGSGNSDIIYLAHDGVHLYFNQAGNRWSDLDPLEQFPLPDSLSSIATADLLGNGTACLAWSSPLPTARARPLRYVDLMGGQKPHLLTKVTNGLGAETRIQYASSTKFYLADKAADKPWITRLPFPIHVVERVETFDHIGRSRFVTRYAYHHGYFDGAEREFCGFGMVEQFDTEQFSALRGGDAFAAGDNTEESSHVPPAYTKTWFHTGVQVDRERVSNFFAGLLDEQDTGEYYREPGLSDVEAARLLLPDTVLPEDLTADEEREACRALKGFMLRQEVYALDRSDREPHPYTVTEQNFAVRMLQAKGSNRHGVFFTHPREALTYQYERNPIDPRISHAFTLAVDDFGNVLRSAAIGYGRRQPGLAAQEEQTRLLISCAETAYTNAVEEDDDYRSPLPCEDSSYELTQLRLDSNQVRFSFDQLLGAVESAELIPYHQTPAGSLQKRLLERVRTRFRPDDLGQSQDDPLTLLPLGRLESRALPGETYTLAFTPEHLNLLFGDRVTEAMLSGEGRYVHFEGDGNWWIPSGRVFLSENEHDSAAEEFLASRQHFFVPVRFRDAFHQTTTVGYDAHVLLVVRTTDPLGNSGFAQFNYRLLAPELITDANRNRSAVAFDVLGRVAGTAVMGKVLENIGDALDGFQAQLTQAQIDSFLAAPRGPIATELLGRATSRVICDEARYVRSGEPVFAATITRITHASELGDGGLSDVHVSLAYSDGFGRTIQNKVQVEAGKVPRRRDDGQLINGRDGQPLMTQDDISPRWVTSGWTIFNNKGKPVRQFEPFFSATHRFEFDVRFGVSPTLFYDPLGRIVGTLHPNHTWEKVVFDPWQQTSYDLNDTVLMDPASDLQLGEYFRRLRDDDYLPTWHALRTDPAHMADALARWPAVQRRQDETAAATKAAAHADTPAVILFDSLGRPFLSISNNGPEGKCETRTKLDIEGNPLSILDDRDNMVMSYRLLIQDGVPVSGYDLAGRRLYEKSMDSGERHMLMDVGGKPIRSWNNRGHILRSTYDALQRPLATYLGQGNDPDQLVTLILYGEKHPRAEALNLRGQIFQTYDQAGVATGGGIDPESNRSEAFDFKGNLLRSSRQLAVNYKSTVDWMVLEPFLSSQIVDPDVFESATASLVQGEIFTDSTRYDALNRSIERATPDGSVTRPIYNEANLLEKMAIRLRRADQATLFVANIDYNARGERQRITYATMDGANFAAVYEYDRESLRLSRLTTLRHRDGRVLQDLSYTYDPVGNITSIRDGAQETVFFANAEVEPHNDYTYDALYRLRRAEGREHAAQNNFQRDAAEFAVLDISFPDSPEALQTYLEEYNYDNVGNILSIRHVGGALERWTRRYHYAAENDRLLATSLPGDGPNEFSARYSYDAHGNMTMMPHLPLLQWDFNDQLQASSAQVVSDNHTPETTYYVYNAAGERVRKVTERQSADGQIPTRREERIYLGGFEIFREYNGEGSTVTLERETLQVVDGQRRIAQIDTRTQGNDNGSVESRRFQLSNHLGSVALELDQQAADLISYEEYHPYGSTAYHAARSLAEGNLKRHRFAGKERDRETSLHYYGARYYACWLGRWTSCDPLRMTDGVNVYWYARDRPTALVDPKGTASTVPGSDQEEAARIQRDRVQNPQATPFPDPDDPNDPRNYASFKEFKAGAVGPWTDEGLLEAWELYGEGGEAQQNREASYARVRQELAAEIAAAEEERGLIDAIDEFVLEQRAASQEAKWISIEHCFATQSDTKHCVMDPNDPAGQIEQNAIDAQQKIGDAVLPGLKARPPAPKVLPPAKGTVRVAKDAKSHAPRYKKEAMKLAETEKTADALSSRGYTVLIRKGDEGLPDLRVKKIGEAGDLIPAESKRLVSGSQTALRNAIKEGTRSGQGLAIIDATGVPLGEANIRRAIKGFLDTSVPARVASGSAGAHGKVVVLYGRYQSIEFSF